MKKTLLRLMPRFLMPDFVWSNMTTKHPFSAQMPPTPAATHHLVQRFWGFVHCYLRYFSMKYCDWIGVEFDNQIASLPFGLVLKWSDGTRVEEVLAMQVAKKAGFPVPKVICYGKHPESPHALVSILMTRVPGNELGQVYETLSDGERKSILNELRSYFDVMRAWESPWGKDRVCSIVGTSLRSARIPSHYGGPFDSEKEFNEYLIEPALASGFRTKEAYYNALARAKKMQSLPHSIVFTHGDLKHHNIMVQNGQITGFLDWESAGWYPDYWDFTTALRFTPKDFWWYSFVIEMGASKYLMEMECERALTSLTVESYVW